MQASKDIAVGGLAYKLPGDIEDGDGFRKVLRDAEREGGLRIGIRNPLGSMPSLRILKVGAGTGGMTVRILNLRGREAHRCRLVFRVHVY